MKNIFKISLLLTICFSLYGCPNADGDVKETNTVDLAVVEHSEEPTTGDCYVNLAD